MAHRLPTVFVSATGPADNIGDALIRRQVVRWARSNNPVLTAYIGENTQAWAEQLGLRVDDNVLIGKASAKRWIRTILTAPRGSIYFFEPGETPLDRGNLKRELAFLAITLSIRLRGGLVVRPPRAVRKHTPLPLRAHRAACSASTLTLWREESSLRLTNVGQVVPDIGFAEDMRDGLHPGDRRVIVVSLRGDRDDPGLDWTDIVRSFASDNGFTIAVVTQVRDDDARGAELARRMNASFMPFGDLDPSVQEHQLRALYDTTALVISDRLHVLILAALSGALPAEVVPHPQPKIELNFATIGFAGVSFSGDIESLPSFLLNQLNRGTELRSAILEARRRLTEVTAIEERGLSGIPT